MQQSQKKDRLNPYLGSIGAWKLAGCTGFKEKLVSRHDILQDLVLSLASNEPFTEVLDVMHGLGGDNSLRPKTLGVAVEGVQGEVVPSELSKEGEDFLAIAECQKII